VLRNVSSDSENQVSEEAGVEVPEDESIRVEKANAERTARRGYLVFATDPMRAPDEPGYREVFVTEAKTPGEARAKVRPVAEGRRLRTFLATGKYKHELADARWIA
jgi:hypothetical protein